MERKRQHSDRPPDSEEPIENRSAVDEAIRALDSIGYLRRTGLGDSVDLFEGMVAFERLTRRSVFEEAISFERAARHVVAHARQRLCDVPDDLYYSESGLQIRAYGRASQRWNRGNLTWSVAIPDGANAAGIIATLNAAFVQWQVASLNFFLFTQVPSNGDIQIAFGGAELSPGLGRRGGAIGSALSPPNGRVFFDREDFPASALSSDKIDDPLLSTALHEIGHALGLGHSTSPGSLMYPFANSALTIDAETRTAIQALYGWTSPARFPDMRSSSDGPTFTSTSAFNFTNRFDRLCMAWRGRGNDSHIWYASSLDGRAWSPQTRIPDARSSHGPAFAAVPSSGPSPILYLAWKGDGNDNRLFWTRSIDLMTFEPHRRFDDRLSTTRPALAEFDGRLVMAWKSSHDEAIYWSTFDGTRWSDQKAIPGRSTSHAPALAAFGNRLFMFWQGAGDDTRIFHASLPAGPLGIWSDGEEVSYNRVEADGMIREIVNTDSHPTAVSRGNALILSYRGQPDDSAVWFMMFENGEWSAPFTVPGAGTFTGPGIGVIDDALMIAWKALDPDYELHFSRLG